MKNENVISKWGLFFLIISAGIAVGLLSVAFRLIFNLDSHTSSIVGGGIAGFGSVVLIIFVSKLIKQGKLKWLTKKKNA